MTQPDNNVLRARRRRVLAAVKRQGASAILITKPQDVRYVTGFTGDDSYAILAPAVAILVTDGRFTEQAANECPDLERVIRTGPIFPAVAGAIKKLRLRTLAVQGGHMTIQGRQLLQKALGRVKIVPLTDILGPLRSVKDEGEVAVIRRAVRAAQEGFKALLAQGAAGWVGRTERQIAAELEYRMRLAGADEASFETIVAVGPHSSLPHYRPGGTRVEKDSFILVDWGARVGGYCSDLTRVAFAGRIPPKMAEVYEVVLRSQNAGRRACRSGVSAAAVDKAARNVIEAAGYGKEFVHGLGHGVGLEIHEAPGLGRLGTGRLRSGMVVTVEPGIYLPGIGGVRIEDDVLIQTGGCQPLTSLPRDLRAMVLR